MARVTVEDCVEKVPNRFELVLVAAQRARDISAGSQITIDRDNDKNPVVALREIADSKIDVEQVLNALVIGLQRQPAMDEPEEDVDHAYGEPTWPAGAGDQAVEDEVGDQIVYADEADADLTADEDAVDSDIDADADDGDAPEAPVDDEAL